METNSKVQPIEYTLRRRKGKRGITIRIPADGHVLVSASPIEPLANIEAFISLKRDWINHHLSRIQSNPAPQVHTWADGDTMIVQGQPMLLRVMGGTKGKNLVTEVGTELILFTEEPQPSPALVNAIMVEYYRGIAKGVLTSKIPQWAQAMNLPVPQFSLVNSHARWGSCSSKGKLSFSVRTATLSDPLMDYLVLHELSHLVHFDHGAKFKALLSYHMPDWKERQKQLFAHQRLSDLRLL